MDRELRQAIVSGRRSFWIPAGVWAISLVLGLCAVWLSRDLPFDAAAWQSKEHLRPRMVQDLLDNHQLVGLHREEIHAMLGRPQGRDSIHNGTYIYWAGTDGVIDDLWLEIDFDNDTASAARYVPD